MASAPLHSVLDAVQASGARAVVVVLRGIYWVLKRFRTQNKVVLI